MALIHFFETPFATEKETVEVKKGTLLKDACHKWLDKKDIREKIETYNLKTGKTEYIEKEINNFKATVLVNGFEKDLDYKVKKDDIVTVIFIPQSDSENAWTAAIGAITAVVGVVMMAFAPTAALGGKLAFLGVSTLIGVGLKEIVKGSTSSSSKKTNDTALDSESLLSLGGGSNQTMTGKRFPLVLGKHLQNPGIVGSTFHTTYTTNLNKATDDGQYITALYCLGYAPLKITDFKIGEVFLAYNRSTENNGAKVNRPTVMHGLLHTTKEKFEAQESSGFDQEDILQKWKANDVSIEILQKGQQKKTKASKDPFWYRVNDDIDTYGNLYNQVVEELEVNANLLNIKDGLIGEAASKAYKGCSIPNGFNSNTVRISRACPMRLEVELNFPSGLYATRTHNNEGTKIKYYNLPVRYAIQWRLVKDGQNSSDSSSPDGWHDFDYIELKNADGTLALDPLDPENNLLPQKYTYAKKLFDYNSSLGKTEYFNPKEPNDNFDKFVIYDNWLSGDKEDDYGTSGRLFEFGTQDEPNEVKNPPEVAEKQYYAKQIIFMLKDYGDGYDSLNSCTDSNENEYKTQWVKVTKEDYDKFYNPDGTSNYDSVVTSDKTLTPVNFDKLYDCQVIRTDSYVPHDEGLEDHPLYNATDGDNWATANDTYYMFKSAIKPLDFDPNYTGSKITEIKINEDGTISKVELGKAGYSPDEFQNASTVNERRYVVVKNFDTKTLRQLTDYDKQGFYDFVEVRVLRITPNYYDETSSESSENSNFGTMSYQDLGKWTTLRTFSFDKDILKDKIKADNTIGLTRDLEEEEKQEIVMRPMSKEDMDKFCFVAIKLKQDAAETGGSSLNQVSCITQSFNPNYVINTEWDENNSNTWYPEINQLKPKYKYYQAIYKENSNIVDEYKELEKDVYDSLVLAGEPNLYCEPNGNNFEDIIKADIFKSSSSGATSGSVGLARHQLFGEIEERYCTSNSAAVALKTLFGIHLKDKAKTYNDVNLEAFTEWYKFCTDVTDGGRVDSEDPTSELIHYKFNCNGIVSNEIKLESLLSQIFTTGRANLRLDEENRYDVVISRAGNYPVTVLNNRNCISQSNTRSFKDVPSGFSCSFIDESDNYTQNDLPIMADGEKVKNPTKDLESFSIPYVTEREQLWSLGRFNLGVRCQQRETYSWTVGKLGYSLSLGDTVLIQSDTLLVGQGIGARIAQVLETEDLILGFITDEMYEYTGETEEGTSLSNQGVTIVQPNKYEQSRCVTVRLASNNTTKTVDGVEYTLTKGLTNIVLFEYGITKNDNLLNDNDSRLENNTQCSSLKPQIDNIVSFGIIGSITEKAVIMGIKPGENDKFTLSLVPYNDSIYNSGASLPAFKANMTRPQRADTTVFSDNITKKDYNAAIANSVSASNTTIINNINKGEGITTPPMTLAYLKVEAEEEGLFIRATGQGLGIANTLTGIKYQICKDTTVENPVWLDEIEINEVSTEYFFKSGEYPERQELSKWGVRAKGRNTYAIYSEEWLEAETIDISAYKTWEVKEPTNVVAKVNRDNIAVSFTNNNQVVYGDISYTIKLTHNGTTIIRKFTTSSFVYTFDREEDGFPSISDFEDNTKWNFEIQVSNGVNTSEYVTGTFDTTNYKGWDLQAPIVTATPSKDYIDISWDGNENNLIYGTKKYLVTIRGNTYRTSEKSLSYRISHTKDGYPEKDDFTKDDWKISVKVYSEETETTNYVKSATTTINPDNTNYGTWILKEPTVTAIPSQNSILIKWNDDVNKDVYGNRKYQIFVKDDFVLETTEKSYTYLFNRDKDGYPERDDFNFENFPIIVNVSNEAGKCENTSVIFDTTNYGTWILKDISSVSAIPAKDNIAISWSNNQSNVYGNIKYDIYVKDKKITTTSFYSITYDFDRTVDGYPEIKDLIDFNIKVIPVNEAGNGGATLAEIISSDYLGWKPKPVEVTATALKNNIVVKWSEINKNEVYGTPRYEVILNKNPTATESNNNEISLGYYYGEEVTYNFDFSKNEYLEKEDLQNWLFKVITTNESTVKISTNISTSSSYTLDDTKYGTWKVNQPFNLLMTPIKDEMLLTWDYIPLTNAYGSVKFIPHLYYLEGEEEKERTLNQCTDTSYSYKFNRDIDKYPEVNDKYNSLSETGKTNATNLSNYRLQIEVVNTESGIKNNSEKSAKLNIGLYKTWTAPKPVLEAIYAEKDGITSKWSYNNNNTYGTVVFGSIVYYDDTEIKRQTGIIGTEDFYFFDRATDGYPETLTKALILQSQNKNIKSIEKYSGKIFAYTLEQDLENIYSNSVNCSSSNYGTWIPEQATELDVTVDSDKITIVPTFPKNTTNYGNPYSYEYVIDRGTVTTYTRESEKVTTTTINTDAPTYIYYFDRNVEGYPEREELADWKIRVRAVSTAGYKSEYKEISLLSALDNYGTWILEAPEVSSRVIDRTAILEFNQPLRASGAVYGNIKYEIQIQRTSVYGDLYKGDSKFYKPATNQNPYPESEIINNKDVEIFGNEDNYKDWVLVKKGTTEIVNEDDYRDKNGDYLKDENGNYLIKEETERVYIETDLTTPVKYEPLYYSSTFTQTLPLIGQSKEKMTKGILNTTYLYRVRAVNETNIPSGWKSIYVTALCTNISDLVKANADYKQLYVEQLSAISANLGKITDGAFKGNEQNYWYLSTLHEDNSYIHKGSFRVGGKEQYLKVTPIVNGSNPYEEPSEYRIEFKVGNFEVSSLASNINGELIVTESSSSLDRTRITPTGTYYEHRETEDSEWESISQMRTDGIKGNSLYSEKSLIVTNQSVQDRRKDKVDVGRPYLSDNSRVWHFDTDEKDQNQQTDLVISKIGDTYLIDQFNSDKLGITFEKQIDFTPAILAVAPYSEIGRSIYGKFSVTKSLGEANKFTIDFWIQYLWCENQTIFDIGNTADKVKLIVQKNEAYFNEYDKNVTNEVPFNEAVREETAVVFNEPAEAKTSIYHYGDGHRIPDDNNVVTLNSLGIEFAENSWLHIGIILNDTDMKVYLDKKEISFPRYSTLNTEVIMELNETQNSFILDELMIDTTVEEVFEDFADNTTKRIAWGALNYKDKHFILQADDLVTNIFDTDLFKNKVKQIIAEMQ